MTYQPATWAIMVVIGILALPASALLGLLAAWAARRVFRS